MAATNTVAAEAKAKAEEEAKKVVKYRCDTPCEFLRQFWRKGEVLTSSQAGKEEVPKWFTKIE